MRKNILIKCCGKNIVCGDVWFLQDIKGFTARKIFIGNCPKCKNDVAVIFEKRIEDNKEFINGLTGIEAVKTIFREKRRKVAVFPDIKTNFLSGWVYGVNVQIKNKKGQVVQVRQYACDFRSGEKQLTKTLIQK